MLLEFADDLDNLVGGSSSVGDNLGSSSRPYATPTLTPRRRTQSQLLELERYVAANGCISMTIALTRRSLFPHTAFASAREYFEVVKGDLHSLFVLDFNDQAMNKFVEHQILSTFKEFRDDCHRSNHGRTRLLDRSSLTIIVEGQSRFYNDNTSSLSKEGSWSTMWSCFDKHMFQSKQSNARTLIPAYLRGHAIRCWVDDRATQKTLVGDPSRRSVRRRVRAIPRSHVHSPQKESFNYKLSLIKH
ncbi:CACTA en-spm transposon protein [Cucumis melo var. makuwa]|nr:CACTA en-spm transposon protein [Cucumis melo var. makuwa]TYK25977.1 CACTA en-spm transposon protein [Cucumis melo var. makuwa]